MINVRENNVKNAVCIVVGIEMENRGKSSFSVGNLPSKVLGECTIDTMEEKE